MTLLAHDAPVVIVSEIAASGRSTDANGDPRTRQFGCEALEPRTSRSADRRIVIGYATRSSGMTLSCAVDHELRTACDYTTEVRTDGPDGRIDFSVDGKEVVLTRREMLLLEKLMERAGTVVTHDGLESTMYGYDDFVLSNTLQAHISRLRRRLADCGAKVRIHTVRGVGYLLRAVAEDEEAP